MNLSWPIISKNNVNNGASGSSVQDIYKRGSKEADQKGPLDYQNPKKSRRHRCAFTTDQVLYLENKFRENRYVTNIERNKIAREIGVSDKSIKVWFQNRRMKEKVALRELDDEDVLLTRNLTYPLGIPKQIEHVQSLPNILSPQPEPLPNVLPPQPMPVPNVVYNLFNNPEMSIEPIEYTPTAFRSTYYEDISPVRDATTEISVYTSSPTKSDSHVNSLKYKASAEFSIDLCKKYKNIITGYKSEDNIITDNTNFSPLSPFDLRMKAERSVLQDEPQDLSMKKFDSINCYESIQKSPTFDNIPQPNVPDGLKWDEITITSAAHNTTPAPDISIFPIPALSETDDNVVPMRSCVCCDDDPEQPVPSTSSLSKSP